MSESALSSWVAIVAQPCWCLYACSGGNSSYTMSGERAAPA